jgi:hypothetical protein
MDRSDITGENAPPDGREGRLCRGPLFPAHLSIPLHKPGRFRPPEGRARTRTIHLTARARKRRGASVRTVRMDPEITALRSNCLPADRRRTVDCAADDGRPDTVPTKPLKFNAWTGADEADTIGACRSGAAELPPGLNVAACDLVRRVKDHQLVRCPRDFSQPSAECRQSRHGGSPARGRRRASACAGAP